MSIPTGREKIATEELVNKCKVFLNDNFHKFTEANKIKISLSLITKSMPTQLEGNFVFNEMPTAKIGNRIGELIPLELDIGDTKYGITGDTIDSGETNSDTN